MAFPNVKRSLKMTPTDKPILSFDVRGLPITAGSKTIGRTKDGRMFIRPEQ